MGIGKFSRWMIYATRLNYKLLDEDSLMSCKYYRFQLENNHLKMLFIDLRRNS